MATSDKNILNPFSTTPSVPAGLENATNKDIVDYLFSNSNRLLTAAGGEFELSRIHRVLLHTFLGVN